MQICFYQGEIQVTWRSVLRVFRLHKSLITNKPISIINVEGFIGLMTPLRQLSNSPSLQRNPSHHWKCQPQAGNANGSRFPNRPLLTALCQAAVRKMPIFNAQHMANMTWAMATLAHKAKFLGFRPCFQVQHSERATIKFEMMEQLPNRSERPPTGGVGYTSAI